MLRINARGVVLTSIIALVLVLLVVAQWKRSEIDAWRSAYAGASTPDIANQDTKLDEFKDDAAAAPSPPNFTAANSTLGVSHCHPSLRLEDYLLLTETTNSSKPSSPSPKEHPGESTASTPQQKSRASPSPYPNNQNGANPS